MSDLIRKIIAKRYRVDSLFGRGGMGDVYKVWDSQRGVFLAMKVLHADLAEDKVFLRRFAREAETLSALQHPHIVRFYELEQEGRLTFMLMDYVEGTTLRGQIFDSSQPFTVEQVLQIVKPVCSALHYAHQMGRVHCDIKSANIMVKSNGDVLVADFGIARMMENRTTTTMAGAGTPAYMAPEQVLGKNPVPQTDIYALGIVLYEMLTGGERPFTGEQAQTYGSTSEKIRWEQVTLQPPSLRKYNPDISPQLEAVVSKCLQKKTEDRYPDAFSLLNAVSAAVKGGSLKPSDVKQPPMISRPAKQSEVLGRATVKKETRHSAPRKTQLALFAWLIGGVLVIVLSLLVLKLSINITPLAPTVAPIVIDVPVQAEASITTEAPVVTKSATMTETPITTETLSPTISPGSTCSSPIEWEAQNKLLGGPPTRIGRPDGNGWSANTGQDRLGYLQYGPYTADVDVGDHVVTWALMIDDNSYDNLPIVHLDVSDYTTGVTILASRDITRREWSKAFKHECFYLPFNLHSSRLGHILEFRVLWYGNAYVHLTKVGLK